MFDDDICVELEWGDTYPAKLYFSLDGVLEIACWYSNGIKHRDDDLPTIITYSDEGFVESSVWYINDVIDRKNHKPSMVSYYSNGSILEEKWLFGFRFHSVVGPALITYDENDKIISEFYYLNGVILEKSEWESINKTD